MSTSEAGDGALDFNAWIKDEIARRGAFTACVILVEIGGQSVTPIASTYLNIIGAEVDWLEIVALFTGAGMPWDGAAFFPATDGAPLDNATARTRLREMEARVKAERLAINQGFFFDRQGRRMMVEETAPQ